MDEVIKEKRLARKKALNDRLNLIRKQEVLNENHCNSCENKNNRQDPTILCVGCPVYAELRKIGDKLMRVNVPKREFAENIPGEDFDFLVDIGALLTEEKVMRVTRGFHDSDGNSFKVGALYKQKSNTKGNRILLLGQDSKEYTVTQHKYYNNFVDINKFVEEYVPDVYVCISPFKSRVSGVSVVTGQEFKLIKEESTLGSKMLRSEQGDVRVSKDIFYRKLEKKRNDDNE